MSRESTQRKVRTPTLQASYPQHGSLPRLALLPPPPPSCGPSRLWSFQGSRLAFLSSSSPTREPNTSSSCPHPHTPPHTTTNTKTIQPSSMDYCPNPLLEKNFAYNSVPVRRITVRYSLLRATSQDCPGIKAPLVGTGKEETSSG